MRRAIWIGTLAAAPLLGGCHTSHDVNVHIDPVEVKPMTLDVNIRVQRDLDNFFDFENKPAGSAPAPAATQSGEGAKQ